MSGQLGAQELQGSTEGFSRSVQLQGVRNSGASSMWMPGSHVSRHSAQNVSFSKQVDAELLQHLLLPQFSPAPEQSDGGAAVVVGVAVEEAHSAVSTELLLKQRVPTAIGFKIA